MEDGEDKVAEKAKFRHPAIPGGLLEPEQRNTGIDDNYKRRFQNKDPKSFERIISDWIRLLQ